MIAVAAAPLNVGPETLGIIAMLGVVISTLSKLLTNVIGKKWTSGGGSTCRMSAEDANGIHRVVAMADAKDAEERPSWAFPGARMERQHETQNEILRDIAETQRRTVEALDRMERRSIE